MRRHYSRERDVEVRVAKIPTQIPDGRQWINRMELG